MTCAAKKHLISEKPLNSAVFQGHRGGVLTGIECSPKIIDFRANGSPVQESVEKIDTLNLYFVGLKTSIHYIYNIRALKEHRSKIGKLNKRNVRRCQFRTDKQGYKLVTICNNFVSLCILYKTDFVFYLDIYKGSQYNRFRCDLLSQLELKGDVICVKY